MKVPFYKCNSKGNSFIIIFPSSSIILSSFQIKKICQSASNELVDGLILLDIDKNQQIASMHYYNNDGTWETFCLNGLICCVLILEKKFNKNNFIIVSNKTKYNTQIDGSYNVKVQIKKPVYKKKNIHVEHVIGDYLDSGAKHLVVNYLDAWGDNIKLKSEMKKIRENKLFYPSGINVNFYKILEPGLIQVKTYEKGIEEMMDSCASGSFASAYDYSMKNGYFDKIKIINDGGNSEVVFENNYKENFFLSKGEIEYNGELEI